MQITMECFDIRFIERRKKVPKSGFIKKPFLSLDQQQFTHLNAVFNVITTRFCYDEAKKNLPHRENKTNCGQKRKTNAKTQKSFDVLKFKVNEQF